MSFTTNNISAALKQIGINKSFSLRHIKQFILSSRIFHINYFKTATSLLIFPPKHKYFPIIHQAAAKLSSDPQPKLLLLNPFNSKPIIFIIAKSNLINTIQGFSKMTRSSNKQNKSIKNRNTMPESWQVLIQTTIMSCITFTVMQRNNPQRAARKQVDQQVILLL